MNTEKGLSQALDIKEEKRETSVEPTGEDRLGVNPKPPVVLENGIEPTAYLPAHHQQEDYTTSRDTYQDLISTGHQAIESLAELAKESESTRAYEALASMIKAVSQVSTALYSHQIKAKSLNNKKENGTTHIDKAVFVGNPADLLSQIKPRK